MTEDREIWACAHVLVSRHGGDAWYLAARRADDLFDQGDLDGQFAFTRILSRLDSLAITAPAGALLN